MGCAKCKALEQMVQDVCISNNYDVDLRFEDNVDYMIRNRIKATPCLLIDGNVYFDESLPSYREVEDLFNSVIPAKAK